MKLIKNYFKKTFCVAVLLSSAYGYASSSVNTKFAYALNANGSVHKIKGPKNLNGFSEPMVQWDECSNKTGKIKGQVTWDYSTARTSSKWPTKASMMVACSKRKVSANFMKFLNKNFSYCVALATLPAAQKEIVTTIYRAGKKTDTSGIDNSVKNAIYRVIRANGSSINSALKKISGISILHQGIIGDNNHSNTSYHSMAALRAIDVSHIKVKTASAVTLYQHNVATYAENLEILKKRSSKTPHQIAQHAFWQSFGACMSAKGAGVISKTLHHSKAGLRHAGHMHLSLPYQNRGKYKTKDVDHLPTM